MRRRLKGREEEEGMFEEGARTAERETGNRGRVAIKD